MAIGSGSPFDHNVFAAASGLSSSPWAKQPQTNQHRFIRKAETRTFNAPVAATNPTKKWEKVHATSSTNAVPPREGSKLNVIVPGGAKKQAAQLSLYNHWSGTQHSRITNGYTKLHNNSIKKSGALRLIPANNFMLQGAVRFEDGVKGWSGNVTNTATGEYATKSSDGKEVAFKIMGPDSWIQVDVDSEIGGYGNSIRLSTGDSAKGSWSTPNQIVTLKIWSIYYQVDSCPTGQTLSGGKCKSKGCKNNKYTEYTTHSVITDNSLCQTCKETAGTGYTVDGECNKVAKAGYTLVGGVAKTVGCKDNTYAEYNANAQVGQQNLCLTCKSGYLMRSGDCKKAGCTDSNATNYDNNAQVNDGSCSCKTGFAKDSNGDCVVAGCTDAGDTGYNSQAVIHDTASCTGTCKGGMETQNGRCVDPAKIGCMDADADNYDSVAAQDDGSCTYSCSDSNRAVTEKGTCAEGCNEGYTLVDGVCEEIVELPGDDALETTNGDTTVTTQTTDVTTIATAKPNTGLIVGGLAVVGILGFMMTRKKKAAEGHYY